MRNIIHLLLPLLAALAAAAEIKPDLICHDELCYPREFVPTTEFQLVHADQEIPPGLHIRMNFETGLKEAKLYIPSPEDANDPNNGVLVVDTPDVDVNEPAILPPKEALVAPGTFSSWSATIKNPHAPEQELLAALAGLEDLAHEIYWGKQLAGKEFFPRLLQLTVAPSSTAEVRAAAALVLGSACGNNPAALKTGIANVGGADGFVAPLLRAVEREKVEVVRARMVWVLSQTAAEVGVRRRFVEMGGLRVVMEAFAAGEAVKAKAAVLVEDTFLNGDMRAEGDERGVQEVRGLEVFCGKFQEAIVGGLGEVTEERVLSALVALKKVVKGCQAGAEFESWMEAVDVEENEGIAELVKEAKDLFYVRKEL